MQINRHFDVEKDFKKLKHFSAPEQSLGSWEALFCLKGIKETPGIDQYPGFGNCKIYKGRVIALKEKFGKSKGYRVIFQMLSEQYCRILAFSRHGIYKTEQELIEIIKERIIL